MLAAASAPQSRNFESVEPGAPITTSALTRNSTGRNDGSPAAKIQSSNGAGENSASTMSQKQMATAARFSSDRRKRTKRPAAVSQQLMTDNSI